MRIPEVPATAPRWGLALTETLGRAGLRVFGWRVEGEIPAEPKLVLIAAPHTSALDVFVALLVLLALRLRIRWMGKHTIFREPLGTVARWFGGIPVDRRTPNSLVRQAVALIEAEPRVFVGLAPEGTRRPVARWKTGYYHIATTARVPILPVALDYGSRAVIIGPPLVPSGDYAADEARLRRHFNAGMARHPERYV